jgi:hypothetical protein
MAYLPCRLYPPRYSLWLGGSLKRTGKLFSLKRSMRSMWKCTTGVRRRTSLLETGICFFYTFNAFIFRARRHFQYFEIKFSRNSVFCKKRVFLPHLHVDVDIKRLLSRYHARTQEFLLDSFDRSDYYRCLWCARKFYLLRVLREILYFRQFTINWAIFYWHF